MGSGPGFGFGVPGGDPESLRDAPLFREIQRVMASSTGPVNWELARQVGVAAVVEGGPDPEPSDDDRRSFDEAVRVAELHVAGFSGLEPPGDVAEVRAVRRADWVNANTQSLRELMEPAARRMADAMERAAREQLPEELQSISPFLQQVSPLLQGAQVGSVLGFLAQHVLGQYDVAVPRSGPGTVLFVVPNVIGFERDWSLDPTEFRTYVALHEVTHRFEFARPWVRQRFSQLLDDFLSTLTIDAESIQRRLEALDPTDPESFERLAQGEEGLFGAVLDDEQRLKLGRIQAFMAAAEGYGDHVMHALGRQLLATYPRIDEAMSRLDTPNDPVFERLLGIEMKREHYEAGGRFCDTVVELTDEATLARMWDGPDAMPSWPEVEEPRLWLARSV
jgi:putative hydrolase